jgi:hypothetical protein
MATDGAAMQEATRTQRLGRNPAQQANPLSADSADAYRDQPVYAGHDDGADPMMSLALRVYGEFADRTTFANVFAVTQRCNHDLDAASVPARPELGGRVARQRLIRQLEREPLGGESSLPA